MQEEIGAFCAAPARKLRRGCSGSRSCEGSIAGYTLANIDSSGAFYNVIIDNNEKKWLKKEPNDSRKLATLSMSAARMGSVYGKSDTVIPASVETPVALYLGRPAQV